MNEELNCVLCGENKACRCNFKKPPKGKWAGSMELYSTVEKRKVSDILAELAKHTAHSQDRRAIFKFTLHYLRDGTEQRG